MNESEFTDVILAHTQTQMDAIESGDFVKAQDEAEVVAALIRSWRNLESASS